MPPSNIVRGGSSETEKPATVCAGFLESRDGLGCGLGAVRAAASGDGNIAEALFARLGRGSRRGLAFVGTRRNGIHRHHNKEVDCSGDEHEADNRIDEVAEAENGLSDVPMDSGKVRLADQYRDQRRDDVLGERSYNGAERSAHDHADREIDDVTTHDKLLET